MKPLNLVGNHIVTRVGHLVWNQVSNNQVWNHVRIQVYNHVRIQVYNHVRIQVYNQVWNQIYNQICDKIKEKLYENT